MLPLPQNDLLEVLVALTASDDAQIASAATETLKAESVEDLLVAATGQDTAPNVLAYLATQADGKQEIYEATILNTRTPDQALAKLAATTSHSSLLELLTINQQRLVRCPEIIDAILGNPARSGEAERRARETRQEFFEKERGARQIADELRARGQTAAAEFFEAAELTTAAGELSLEDAWLIAEHIEVSDADLDDTWLPAERFDELIAETAAEVSANVQRVIENERRETGRRQRGESLAYSSHHVHEYQGQDEAGDERRPRGPQHSRSRFQQSGLFRGGKESAHYGTGDREYRGDENGGR